MLGFYSDDEPLESGRIREHNSRLQVSFAEIIKQLLKHWLLLSRNYGVGAKP